MRAWTEVPDRRPDPVLEKTWRRSKPSRTDRNEPLYYRMLIWWPIYTSLLGLAVGGLLLADGRLVPGGSLIGVAVVVIAVSVAADRRRS